MRRCSDPPPLHPRGRSPRTESEACAAGRGRSPRRRQAPLMTRVTLMTCPLLTWPPVPAGRRAEQYICLPWLVSLLIVLTGVSLSLFPSPSPPTPFAPGSPYGARPGISRFRGTPTAPETRRPSLSRSLSLSLSLSPGCPPSLALPLSGLGVYEPSRKKLPERRSPLSPFTPSPHTPFTSSPLHHTLASPLHLQPGTTPLPPSLHLRP